MKNLLSKSFLRPGKHTAFKHTHTVLLLTLKGTPQLQNGGATGQGAGMAGGYGAGGPAPGSGSARAPYIERRMFAGFREGL